ncbi:MULTISPECIES: S4 domain-containing protein YaaA [Streptococcus]|uniref:S4 domain-containing protein YaaA n=1 Tax=Streptococcus caledonicus TaxID=2614158 RepID=A0ABW0UAU4_9STRE|nr:S4 domain-containing protein YaaA [Streptococcus sp. S784/96/1]
MEYTLFDDFITLQALLKELSIIQSGGAIKSFLTNNIVLFNGEKEERRGKKIRVGDIIELPEQNIIITLRKPDEIEIQHHLEDLAEKKRVASLVKQLNKTNKSKKKLPSKKSQSKEIKDIRPVRFPGT